MWSPDGKEIVFASRRGGNMDVYLVNVDGTNERRLTNRPGIDGYPAWSPDGQQIAFCTDRDGNDEIYVMDADGSNLRNLTNHPSSDCENPAWSHSGEKIAFYTDRDGNRELYVMDADGSNQIRVTRTQGFDLLTRRAWSPDDSKFVYCSTDDHIFDENGGPDRYDLFEIYVADVDGSNVVKLTEDGEQDSYPAWSPDGKTILYVHFETGGGMYDVHLMNADGSNKRRLTDSPANQFDPDWSPDGSKIVYFSNESGKDALYIMNPDGSNPQQITNF
jgi:Tol biopolymer transport system component